MARALMHPASVNCHHCSTCVWEGGTVAADEDRSITDLPFGDVEDRDGNTISIDAQSLLTEYADSSCTVDDCPHKTAAVAAARAQDPAELAGELARLRVLVEQLQAGT